MIKRAKENKKNIEEEKNLNMIEKMNICERYYLFCMQCAMLKFCNEWDCNKDLSRMNKRKKSVRFNIKILLLLFNAFYSLILLYVCIFLFFSY